MPEEKPRAVKTAADVLELSIEDLRTSLRVAAEERAAAAGAVVIEEVEDAGEEDMRRIMDGNEETEVVNATEESLERTSAAVNTKREGIKGGPSELLEEKENGRDIIELWKAIEMIKLEMKEERELQNKEHEKEMEDLKVQNKSLEEKIAKMEGRIIMYGEKIEEMDAEIKEEKNIREIMGLIYEEKMQETRIKIAELRKECSAKNNLI